MNRPEYDFSKFVEVPDAWIEKAMDIPNAQASIPRSVSFAPRRIAAAAGAVIAVGIGLSSYFLFRNISSAPTVLSSPSSSESSASSARQIQGSAGTESDIFPSEPSTNKPSPEAAAGLPTEGTAAYHTEPDVTSNQTDPTCEVPSEPQTQPPDEKHTEPSQAPEPPVEIPVGENATEPGLPQKTDDAERHAEIVEPLCALSTDAGYTANESYVRIYCRVYDSSGRLTGDPDPYSEARLAQLFISGGQVFMRFDFVLTDIGAHSDSEPHQQLFTYEFCDERGNILAAGSLTADY